MSKQPNIASGLLHIHHVITRGLNVSLAKSEEFAQHGFPDSSLRNGFANYVRALVAVLRAHHLTEDELAFPYFRAKIPNAPFDALEAEHHALEPLLPQIESLAGKIESESQAGPVLRELSQLLRRLDDVWHQHIQKEEEYFPEAVLAKLISPEEHIRLLQEFGTHSQQIAKPDYLVVPFLLYNLEEEERKEFSRPLPAMLLEQLVPVAWKDQWATMRPFLLS